MTFVPHQSDALAARKLVGQVVGNGQCVTLIHHVSSILATPYWRRGEQVQGNHNVAYGTVIATFDAIGTYGNHTDHTSHAAIFLYQTIDGIEVLEQYKGHAVHERTIRFNNDYGYVVDQGENYYVVD